MGKAAVSRANLLREALARRSHCLLPQVFLFGARCFLLWPYSLLTLGRFWYWFVTGFGFYMRVDLFVVILSGSIVARMVP